MIRAITAGDKTLENKQEFSITAVLVSGHTDETRG